MPVTRDLGELDPGASSAVAVAEAEAVAMSYDRVGTGHLLLGLLTDGTGGAAVLLHAAGARLSAARPKVREALSPAPADGRSPRAPLTATSADDQVPPVRAALPCPSCGVDLDGNLASRTVPAAGEQRPHEALVFWCRGCGHVLGASPA